MKITFRKETKEVVMLNQGIDNAFLSSAVVLKDDRMFQGYKMYYENGGIRFEKPPQILNEEKVIQTKTDFDKDIISIQKAVDLDDKTELKNLLINLVRRVYNQ